MEIWIIDNRGSTVLTLIKKVCVTALLMLPNLNALLECMTALLEYINLCVKE